MDDLPVSCASGRQLPPLAVDKQRSIVVKVTVGAAFTVTLPEPIVFDGL